MFKARVVRQALQRKGFREDRKRDHCYYFLYYDGQKSSIYTKISHNETDLDDYLCGCMAKQTKLTKTQFKELVDCRLSLELYVQILIAAEHLRPNPPHLPCG